MSSATAQLGYCDEKILAQTLAVSLSTVRRWRQFRNGPKFVRFGKSVRYRLADVEEWVAAQSQSAARSRGTGHSGVTEGKQ